MVLYLENWFARARTRSSIVMFEGRGARPWAGALCLRPPWALILCNCSNRSLVCASASLSDSISDFLRRRSTRCFPDRNPISSASTSSSTSTSSHLWCFGVDLHLLLVLVAHLLYNGSSTSSSTGACINFFHGHGDGLASFFTEVGEALNEHGQNLLGVQFYFHVGLLFFGGEFLLLFWRWVLLGGGVSSTTELGPLRRVDVRDASRLCRRLLCRRHPCHPTRASGLC